MHLLFSVQIGCATDYPSHQGQTYHPLLHILSRRPASVGYLKSFGCLVRVTIPLARRDGDRHFADRGMLGIYLGPSEQSPGCIVYVPSAKKFYVTRDVICYEDVHPGVRHLESKWSDLPDDLEGTPLVLPSDANSTQPILQEPNAPLSSERRESVQLHFTPDTEVEGEGNPTELTAEGLGIAPPLMVQGEAAMDPSEPNNSALAEGTSAGPDPSLDPNSRQFKRVLPDRLTRYKGAYQCSYVDPSEATPEQAIANALNLRGDALLARSDIIVYESCVDNFAKAYVVTVTNELGQVQIPKGYHHSLRMREGPYWREAILKEYRGLLAIGTFEFVKLSGVPRDANVMRCHLVFDLKRNGDRWVH